MQKQLIFFSLEHVYVLANYANGIMLVLDYKAMFCTMMTTARRINWTAF